MLLLHWLPCLAWFLATVHAGGLAGCLEKLFLEDCYNVFQVWFDVREKAKENKKNKQKPARGQRLPEFSSGKQDIMFQKGQSKNAANSGWGHGPLDGYDFREFMDEVISREKGRCTVSDVDANGKRKP
jgi:hypothetical protein